MEIPMTMIGLGNETTDDTASIEDQYEQGPDAGSPEQKPMTPEQANEFLDNTLPLMRKQDEYDQLMIKQLTNDALLNRRPIAQIPGLLGMELKVREIEAQQILGKHAAMLSEMVKEQQDKERVQKATSLQSGITQSLQYNGDNAGQIIAITKGEPVETAAELKVSTEGNPDRRITFQTVDTTERSGYRQISLVPGMWIVKCGNGDTWGMTNTEYQAAQPKGPSSESITTPTV